MTVHPTHPEIKEIKTASSQMAMLLREMGEHQPALASMHEEVKEEGKTLEQIGIERIEAIMKRLSQFADTESGLSKLKTETKITLMDLETCTVLKYQFKYIDPYMTNCIWFGNQIFERILKRVEDLFQLGLKRLDDYRKSREFKNIVALNSAALRLNQGISYIGSDRLSFLQEPLAARAKELKQKYDHFILLVPLKPTNAFLNAIDASLNHDFSSFSLTNEWDNLSHEMKKAIDQKINDHFDIIDPLEESDLRKLRFSDLTVLREACLEVMKDALFKEHKNLSKLAFCKLLHQCAFGDEKTDPIDWVHRELPYLVPLLSEVDWLYESQK